MPEVLAEIKQELEKTLNGGPADEENPPIVEDEESLPKPMAEEPEDEGVTTLEGLAETLGVEMADLYGLEIRVNNGSDVVTTTLGELKDQHLGVKSERERLQAEMEEAKQKALEVQAQAAQQTSGMTQEYLVAIGRYQDLVARKPEYERAWAEHAEKNPGAVALQRQQYNEAVNEALMMAQQAQVHQNQLMEQWRAEQERQKAIVIPGYRDPAKKRSMLAEVSDFIAKRYGVDPKIADNMDIATMRMALDAMSGVKNAENTVKAVEKIQRKGLKLTKGARVTPKAKAHREETLTQKARETGRSEDKLAAARAVFGID